MCSCTGSHAVLIILYVLVFFHCSVAHSRRKTVAFSSLMTLSCLQLSDGKAPLGETCSVCKYASIVISSSHWYQQCDSSLAVTTSLSQSALQSPRLHWYEIQVPVASSNQCLPPFPSPAIPEPKAKPRCGHGAADGPTATGLGDSSQD